MPRKRPNHRKIIDAVPSGRPLERIARDTLQALGTWQLRYFEQIVGIQKQIDPVDPLISSQRMAAAFIPFIDTYIDEGGRTLLAELGQQAPNDWLVENPQAIEAARTATLALCQETVDTFLGDMERTMAGIRADLAESFAAGETSGDAVDRLAKWVNDESRWRARRIAVTESARAFNAGAVAATNDLDFIAGYKWLLSDDACPMCHAVARLCPVIPKGGTFAINGKNPAYRNVKFPPLHPNCVLGETPISVASIVSALHAKYQGPIVRLECSDGSCFAVTANHMLLTPSGFARAIDLVKGDDVLRTSSAPESFSAPSLDSPNKHDRPATADEIFRAFSESGRVTSARVPVSSEYLHGDSALVNGDIDIVRADGLLWRDVDSFLGQPLNHVDLVGRNDFGIAFDRQCGLASLLNALSLATDGGVSSVRESHSLLWGSFRHSLEHGLGSVSWANSNLAKSANDHRSRNTKAISDTLDRFPGLMSTAKVVKVDIEFPQDPVSVYDFETFESMYIIDNGIASSNCRCTLVTVFDDEVPAEWPNTVTPPPGQNYVLPTSDDIMAAEAGGYESVTIGNAKSIGGFVVAWE